MNDPMNAITSAITRLMTEEGFRGTAYQDTRGPSDYRLWL